MPGRAIREPDAALTRRRPMAAGNRNLIVRGLWLGGSHLKLPFGLRPGSARRIGYPSKVASEGLRVRSELFGSSQFCFAALLGLRFVCLLCGDQVLLGLGWGTRSLGLLRRLDQLEVAVAQFDVASNPQVRARRQGFSLLVLPLLQAQHTEVMQGRGIVRLDMQGTLQRGSGLVQLAIFVLTRGGFDQRGGCAVALRGRCSLGSYRVKRRDGAARQDEAWQKTLGWHQGQTRLISDGTAMKAGHQRCPESPMQGPY